MRVRTLAILVGALQLAACAQTGSKPADSATPPPPKAAVVMQTLVATSEQCPVYRKPEAQIGPVAAALVASVGGALIDKGVDAIAAAVRKAGEEHSTTFEDKTSGFIHRMDVARNTFGVHPSMNCLIVVRGPMSSDAKPAADILDKAPFSEPASKSDKTSRQLADLHAAGIPLAGNPDLYLEAQLETFASGVIRYKPVFLAYNKPLDHGWWSDKRSLVVNLALGVPTADGSKAFATGTMPMPDLPVPFTTSGSPLLETAATAWMPLPAVDAAAQATLDKTAAKLHQADELEAEWLAYLLESDRKAGKPVSDTRAIQARITTEAARVHEVERHKAARATCGLAPLPEGGHEQKALENAVVQNWNPKTPWTSQSLDNEVARVLTQLKAVSGMCDKGIDAGRIRAQIADDAFCLMADNIDSDACTGVATAVRYNHSKAIQDSLAVLQSRDEVQRTAIAQFKDQRTANGLPSGENQAQLTEARRTGVIAQIAAHEAALADMDRKEKEEQFKQPAKMKTRLAGMREIRDDRATPIVIGVTVTETRDANRFLLALADVLDGSKAAVKTALKSNLPRSDKDKEAGEETRVRAEEEVALTATQAKLAVELAKVKLDALPSTASSVEIQQAKNDLELARYNARVAYRRAGWNVAEVP